MRKLFTTLLVFLSLSLAAKEVPSGQAKLVAMHFLEAELEQLQKGSLSLDLELMQLPDFSPFDRKGKSAATGEPLLYHFSIGEDRGFILVSAEDRARPVLAYSLDGKISSHNLPDNYRKWIEAYRKQIRHIRSLSGESSLERHPEWDRLLGEEGRAMHKSATAVAPLLSTQWDQSPYVNDLCPYDAVAGERTVSGCAATAMAQIMKFWNYPASGSGNHSYAHNDYGTLSASFGSTTYNWSSMPDQLTAPNQAVATLMYHCGVSIEMDYGVAAEGGSGAYVINDRSPVEHCVEYALETYFKYDEALRGVVRANYSSADWIDLLKTELDNGRPIEYAGFGSGGGHAFVCDGYDNNDFFHFNWGWGGYYDGYFSIDALDPGGTGIGGGSGGYNSGHQALIGIQPPSASVENDLRLYTAMSISENPLFYSSSFNVDAELGNYGSSDFNGDICAAVLDTNFTLIEYVEILEGVSMQAGFAYEVIFEHEGSLNLVPGQYMIMLFYRQPGKNWEAFGNGDFLNHLELEIYYAADIELYSDFVLSSGQTITSGEALSIAAEVYNSGSSSFNGEIAVDLYTLDGNYIETIETLTGVSMDAETPYPFSFESQGIVTEPGTYLLALTHRTAGGDWYLSGSSYASNPTRVIIKSAPLMPDMYEENDEVEEAYHLIPSFVGNSATIETPGSNNHLGTDLDFYYLDLEEGYDYTLDMRVHDSYNSGNGMTYSNDVIWIYATEDIESDLYDDVMPTPLSLSNGGTVVLGVAPYFEGETGSYLLDIAIERSAAVSTGKNTGREISVYPNPASDLLFIKSDTEIDRLCLLDSRGRIVLEAVSLPGTSTLNTGDLSPGIYFLHIRSNKQSSIQKIIIQ